MQPLIPDFTPFTPDRISSIRLSRELSLSEARTRAITKSTRTKTTRRPQLDAKGLAALSSLDPKTQELLKAALGL